MRFRSMALAAITLALGSSASAQVAGSLSPDVRRLLAVDAPVVALTHVRVLDGTGAAPASDQTIVIDNGRITAVGPSATVRAPAGARTLDLTGSTVIPGLIGLHNHTYYRGVQLTFAGPRLYLGGGVTTIRTTGAMQPYAEIYSKRAIDRGAVPGPRMIITGPYLTGEDYAAMMAGVADAEAARRLVNYWADEGVTWFKLYTTISYDAAKAAIEEAHKRGVKVTGHICSLSFREAADLGIDNIEHALPTMTDFVSGKKQSECPRATDSLYASLDINGPQVQATIRDLVARKIPLTSTQAVFELFVPNRPPLDQRILDALGTEARNDYLTSRARIAADPSAGRSLQAFRNAQKFDYAFAKAGGLLASGVDATGNGGTLPGYGDQRNFELLVESGFTPSEAVQVMTLNGAKILGMDKEIGSIAVGKKADLVVLNGDLTADPMNIRKVSIVFKDGAGYDPAKLLDPVKGTVGR